jgi:hypothetical protein
MAAVTVAGCSGGGSGGGAGGGKDGGDGAPKPLSSASPAPGGSVSVEQRAQEAFDALAKDAPPAPRPDGEAQWEILLAENAEDYSVCAEPATGKSGCKKPASLGRRELKQAINVEIVLDASGSMNESVGGRRKMDVARAAIGKFTAQLPKAANVSVRTFGNGADEPKNVSCASSTLVVPFGPANPTLVEKTLAKTKVQGYTPLAGALDKARADFSARPAATSSNFVYVVSDGQETCDGNPVAAAKALTGSQIDVQVNVIGFAVDSTSTRQLKAAAAAGRGIYAAAGDEAALDKAFDAVGDWEAWTAYYNCRFTEIDTLYREHRWKSQNVKLCFDARATRERFEVGKASQQQFQSMNAMIKARDDYFEAAIPTLPDDVGWQLRLLIGKDTVRRYDETSAAHSIVVKKAEARQEQVFAMARARQATLVQQAQSQREQAIARLQDLRDQVGIGTR